ncbi:unnamed protein product [Cylicocyclus nassatus]|uniref:Alpha-amylase C-terminal domain-containing protein n=1 Tax=Cylicocyclus nassatus TaxID=53992 RepID=A0AA36M362_CYLNA|nr:unnamed protein product [Cylicocyclus nassatus]
MCLSLIEIFKIVEKFRALAFARKGKGFFAITESLVPFTRVYQTTLPGGTYCDVWSGYLKDGVCTGKNITVESDGAAEIDVFPVVAISLASKIDTSETTIPSQTSRLTTHHPQSSETSSPSHPTQTVTQTTPTQSSSKLFYSICFCILSFSFLPSLIMPTQEAL